MTIRRGGPDSDDSLRTLVGGDAREREVREEMEAHVAHRVDDLVGGGMDEGEARRRAEAEFGDRDRLVDETVAAAPPPRRSGLRSGVDELAQDARFALRQLGRRPGLAAVLVATLAVGIGATASIVAVVDAVVLQPLPFERPEELVFVEEVTPSGENQFSVSEPTFADWRAQSGSFSEMGALGGQSATLTGRGEPRALGKAVVSASLLPTLGVTPHLGRGFRPDEDAPGDGAPVAVLGHALWADAFGADPDVVGTDVVLSGEAHRVVGVLPPDLPFLEGWDLLVPLGADPVGDRTEHYLDVVGRLAPGTSLEQARTEMEALATRLGTVHPEDRGWGVLLTPFDDVLVDPEIRRAGWLLLAAAALLLLIACVNVSNVLLARATVRRGEMGLRAALGAGRGRLARQLFTEGAVLTLAGAAAGVVLARALLPAVEALGAGRVPRLDQAALSPGVLGVTAVAAGAAALLFGLAPLAELGRGGAPRIPMAGGGRRLAGGGRRLRDGLVAGQVALCLVLLVGTGLLARSLQRLTAVDPGFEARGALTVRLSLPPEQYPPDERGRLVQEIVDAAEALPGVRAAGASAIEPFSAYNLMNFVAAEGRVPADAADFLSIAWRPVTPGFVEAMGLELLAGRDLRPDEEVEENAPVLVSASLARRLWPGEEAVGRRLVWGDPGEDASRFTVVGVVEDLRDWRLDEPPQPMVLLPHQRIPWSVMTVVVRTEPDAASVAEPLRATLRAVAPGLAVPGFRSLGHHLRSATAGPRFRTVLLGVFAAAGLLLAAVGVYGVTAFAVTRRFREIGVRLAVGGDPSEIRRMVLGESLRTTALGIAVGLAGAWALGRWMESLLYGVEPTDPLTWAGGVGVLLAAGVAAAWIPARRATRVDPREVLAAE